MNAPNLARLDLHEAEISPVPQVVEALEDLLEQARNGTLRSFCLAGTLRAGDVCVWWTQTDNHHLQVAAVSRLLYKMHQSLDGQATVGEA